jgi:hypothetical protein
MKRQCDANQHFQLDAIAAISDLTLRSHRGAFCCGSELEALAVLAPLNRDRRELMAKRIARRLTRERGRQH